MNNPVTAFILIIVIGGRVRINGYRPKPRYERRYVRKWPRFWRREQIVVDTGHKSWIDAWAQAREEETRNLKYDGRDVAFFEERGDNFHLLRLNGKWVD